MISRALDGVGVPPRGSRPDMSEWVDPRRSWRLARATRFRVNSVELARRFRANVVGATAVEFSLVALPFISLLAAIIQTGLGIWTAQNLDDALQKATRTILTGSFQGSNVGQTNTTNLTKLQEILCGTSSAKIVQVFNCNNLKLDVATSSTFAAASVPVALDSSTKNWTANFGTRYTCAAPGSIVVVTAAVKYPVFFSFLNVGVPTFSDGSRLIQSTAVFRTEPSDTSSC